MVAMLNEFVETFGPKFVNDKRWDAFYKIAQNLLLKNKPIGIAETGTARTQGNWAGDGQSTLMWDWIIQKTKGFGMSIDIDPDACITARKSVKLVKILNYDSIMTLRHFDKAENLDLLYLDSYDWSEQLNAKSSLHHIGELAAIWERLPSKCLIAMDDCHGSDPTSPYFMRQLGKHIMVKKFFEMDYVPCLFESYVTIWEKP